MELHVFARFHSAAGQEDRMAGIAREQTRAVRREPGCLFIQACRSTRDPAQFFLFSRWEDEPAFQVHADLPETAGFIARMEALSDRPVDVNRSRPVDGESDAAGEVSEMSDTPRSAVIVGGSSQ